MNQQQQFRSGYQNMSQQVPQQQFQTQQNFQNYSMSNPQSQYPHSFPNQQNTNMNQMQTSSFLSSDFFGLTDADFGAQDLVGGIVDDAYSSCMIFLERKKHIDSIVYTLENYEQNFNNHNFGNNQDLLLSKGFQTIVDSVEKDTVSLIIQKRIKETKIVENFQQLSESFEQNDVQAITKIKRKYDALGVLNLVPEEYLIWLNIIKESQQKLNIITGYSNIIQNTLANIQQYERQINPQRIRETLTKFEADAMSFIKNFS